MTTFESHLRRAAFVLLVFCIVLFVPAVAFGQVLDADGVDLLGSLLARAGEDATSPAFAGACVFFIVYLATRAPYTSALVGRWLVSDMAKRAFALAVSLAPALATVLMGHMAWNKALGTALMSFAVSQAIFFLSKKKEAAAPLLLCLLVATSQVACTGKQVEQLRTAVEAARDVAVIAEPCAARSREQMLKGCDGDAACAAKVEEAYEPIATALNAFHDAWCALSPQSEGC